MNTLDEVDKILNDTPLGSGCWDMWVTVWQMLRTGQCAECVVLGRHDYCWRKCPDSNCINHNRTV